MYAVLQMSLEPPISREVLEAAVMVTQQLAKPDCARLQRQSIGIVAGNLSQDDALALQTAFRDRGVETEVVSETDLPSLATPHHPQAFTVAAEGVTVTDYTGQSTLLPMSTFVFAAGGHVKHLVSRPCQKLEWVEKPAGDRVRSEVALVIEQQLKDVLEFRIEFYFAQAPFRFQCILDEKAIVRANGRVLKLRDQSQLDSLLLEFANTFPVDQTNLGIKKVAAGEDFVYPSVHAFEAEIIWSLYQLARNTK